MGKTTSGLPRSWALVVVSGGAASLVRGRVLSLAAATLAGAALYPSAGVLCGLVLTGLLLILPAADRGRAAIWSLPQRLLVLAGTAILALAVLAPMWMEMRGYGPRLGESDIADYPELGKGGRYGAKDRPPYANIFGASYTAYNRGFIGHGPGWIPPITRSLMGDGDKRKIGTAVQVICTGFIALTVAGLFPIVRRRVEIRRLIILLAAPLVGYTISVLAAPHMFIPHRFVVYGLPIFAVLALPVALGQIGAMLDRSGERPWLPLACVVAGTIACTLLVGGRGGGGVSLDIRIDPEDPFYETVRGLPKDALLAGWPGAPIDNIPFVARRPALVTWETHQAFNRDFADEMRRRMRALIEAYFATSPAPLLALRDDFGVTHLVVDTSHYGEEAPTYFEPFDQWIPPAHAAMRASRSEVLHQLEDTAIFRSDDIVILDLSKLEGSSWPMGRKGVATREPYAP